MMKKNRSNNTRRRKPDIKRDDTPHCAFTSPRVSEKTRP